MLLSLYLFGLDLEITNKYMHVDFLKVNLKFDTAILIGIPVRPGTVPAPARPIFPRPAEAPLRRPVESPDRPVW